MGAKHAGSETGVPPVKIIFAATFTFLITAVLLFTWAGQNWSALADLVRAIPNFAARAGGQGHEKPFWYYVRLLAGGWSGAAVLVAAGIGLCRAFRSPAAGTRFAIAIYALLIAVIYSAIPYKTPWLALNFWLPVAAARRHRGRTVVAGVATIFHPHVDFNCCHCHRFLDGA